MLQVSYCLGICLSVVCSIDKNSILKMTVLYLKDGSLTRMDTTLMGSLPLKFNKMYNTRIFIGLKITDSCYLNQIQSLFLTCYEWAWISFVYCSTIGCYPRYYILEKNINLYAFIPDRTYMPAKVFYFILTSYLSVSSLFLLLWSTFPRSSLFFR